MDINLLFTRSDFIKIIIKQQSYFASALKTKKTHTSIILMQDCLRVSVHWASGFIQYPVL